MRRASAMLILLLVGGCAASRSGPPGRGPAGGRAPPATLFISPAGEPFRDG
ncbi:MAG: hypothetical protein JWM33_137, partial [Caulobacteraceae bacterium]|nr:hypothetical protein [Caulobacteraceae bacterium]